VIDLDQFKIVNPLEPGMKPALFMVPRWKEFVNDDTFGKLLVRVPE
jgi:hypothetical protein